MGMLTPANEDYIESIYELAGKKAGVGVRSVDLAAKLKVSKASVNKAVGLLKSAGFVEQAPYGDVILTPEGAAYGAAVLERHHLLLAFLTQELGVDYEVAQEEACMMEHAISDDTLKRWAAYMRDINERRRECAGCESGKNAD
ncbi:MAG: metal-dependent transcriptional regulator [Coriobacteriales bacterium]|nr:metal-dependent transcriptional regulator [Coriobacteriales bacterium]